MGSAISSNFAASSSYKPKHCDLFIFVLGQDFA